jgi:hypothetical protein
MSNGTEQNQATAANFFAPAANTLPYFKVGLEGFAGSGKSFTMAQIAIELHQAIKSQKPVVMFDTEKAARFLMPLFSKVGIEMYVKESRALSDLSRAIELCEQGFADILLIDSVSHVWEGYLEAFKAAKVKAKGGTIDTMRLEFQDWGILKPRWKEKFSDPFVRSRVHVLFTGRAGFEWANEMVEQPNGQKKREIYKSGIKMKVEGETAYEPDVLVLMERFEKVLDDNKRVWREAMILKDRSGLIDGKVIENPTGRDFRPVIDFLLNAPTSDATPAREADDRRLFDLDSDGRERRQVDRAILVEQIESELLKGAPGQKAEEKQWRLQMMEKHFSVASWKFIESRAPQELLERGLSALKAEVVLRLTEDPSDPDYRPALAESIKREQEKKRGTGEPQREGDAGEPAETVPPHGEMRVISETVGPPRTESFIEEEVPDTALEVLDSALGTSDAQPVAPPAWASEFSAFAKLCGWPAARHVEVAQRLLKADHGVVEAVLDDETWRLAYLALAKRYDSSSGRPRTEPVK